MPRKPAPIKHGTYGGYQTHARRGTPTCKECLRAARDYRIAYYNRSEIQRRISRFNNRTYSKALTELAGNHRDEFQQILARVRAEAKEALT
jgi:hypothetical protein